MYGIFPTKSKLNTTNINEQKRIYVRYDTSFINIAFYKCHMLSVIVYISNFKSFKYESA